jgi:hypothetical protein
MANQRLFLAFTRRIEWSKAGAEAVQGKMYRAFSPSFFVDSPKANPAKVTGAPLDMGALTNDPAFKKISPLWASAGRVGEDGTNQKINNMTPEELAKLQARIEKLEKENAELNAKAASSANDEVITAKNEEITQLKQALKKVQGEIKARNKERAKAPVKAAVARGAFAAQRRSDPGQMDCHDRSRCG